MEWSLGEVNETSRPMHYTQLKFKAQFVLVLFGLFLISDS